MMWFPNGLVVLGEDTLVLAESHADRPEPVTILEELLRVARVATMRAAAAGCKLM
jgi:hypothetical protein